MQCDICGKNEILYKTLIEGVEMDVCEECAGLGKKLRSVKEKDEFENHANRIKIINVKNTKHIPAEKETYEEVVENFGEIIKTKREKLGLKQKELAIMAAERESLIQNIESGHFKPNIETAKKFEKLLKIKLIENIDDEDYDEKKDIQSMHLTLGDIIDDAKKRTK